MLLGTLPDVRDRLAHTEAACGEMKDGVDCPGLVERLGAILPVDGWVIAAQLQH